MIEKWFLYELINPIDGEPYYVGITGSPLRDRRRGHVTSKCYVNSLIKKSGLKIEIRLIGEFECDFREALKIEAKHIREYKNRFGFIENKELKVDYPKFSRHIDFWTNEDTYMAFIEECYNKKKMPNELLNTIIHDRYYHNKKTTK